MSRTFSIGETVVYTKTDGETATARIVERYRVYNPYATTGNDLDFVYRLSSPYSGYLVPASCLSEPKPEIRKGDHWVHRQTNTTVRVEDFAGGWVIFNFLYNPSSTHACARTEEDFRELYRFYPGSRMT